jgi:hypothetical protein
LQIRSSGYPLFIVEEFCPWFVSPQTKSTLYRRIGEDTNLGQISILYRRIGEDTNLGQCLVLQENVTKQVYLMITTSAGKITVRIGL